MCKISFKCQCAAQLFIWLNCGISSSPNNVCQQLNPPGGNTFEGISMGRGGEIGDNLWGWMGLLLLISCPWGSPEMPRFPILVRVTAAGLGCFCYLGLIREFTATWSLGCGSAAWPTSPSNDGNGTGNGEHRGCQKSPGMVNEHREWWTSGMLNSIGNAKNHQECWMNMGNGEYRECWILGMLNSIGNDEYRECWTSGMINIGNDEWASGMVNSTGNAKNHRECWMNIGNTEQHQELWTSGMPRNAAPESWHREYRSQSPALAPGLVFPNLSLAPGMMLSEPFPWNQDWCSQRHRGCALRALPRPWNPRFPPGFSALGASPHPPWAQGHFRGVKRSQVSSWSCRMKFCLLEKDINAGEAKGENFWRGNVIPQMQISLQKGPEWSAGG